MISILIPACNSAPYLRECLDSALAQRGVSCEILVYDDGSTDETPQILAGYGSRITWWRGEKNRGVSYARNQLLKRAGGDFLAFLDSDDVFAPDKLRKQLAYLLTHPRCQIVFCDYENFFQDSEVAKRPRARHVQAVKVKILLPTALFRRELRSRMIFDESLDRAEDTELFYRLEIYGVDLTRVLPESLYRRRIRNGSLTVEQTGRNTSRKHLLLFLFLWTPHRVRRVWKRAITLLKRRS